jgi:hypothetical protein
MEFHFPHCALIQPSAWKGYSPKFVSRIPHSPGPMPQGVSYVHSDHELANIYIRKPQAGPLHGSLVTWVSEDLTGMLEG